MADFEINGKPVFLDTGKEFMDFYFQGGKGNLVPLNLEGMLKSIQSGATPVDENLKEYMTYLKRWVTDAPRKRVLRQMRLEGFRVITSDALFEASGGDKIIDSLEYTGVFAAQFLREVYGEK